MQDNSLSSGSGVNHFALTPLNLPQNNSISRIAPAILLAFVSSATESACSICPPSQSSAPRPLRASRNRHVPPPSPALTLTVPHNSSSFSHVTFSPLQIAAHLFGPASDAEGSRGWTIETKYYTAHTQVYEFCGVGDADVPNVRPASHLLFNPHARP